MFLSLAVTPKSSLGRHRHQLRVATKYTKHFLATAVYCMYYWITEQVTPGSPRLVVRCGAARQFPHKIAILDDNKFRVYCIRTHYGLPLAGESSVSVSNSCVLPW